MKPDPRGEAGDRARSAGDGRPDVTVVIPAYNASSGIGETLSALMEQTFSRDRFEVIVVDDGSTDDTAEVAARFPVRVIRQTNQGPASARSHGAREARGEVVVFTDSDCVPASTFLERLHRPFQEDPETDAAMGAYRTRSRSLISRFAQVEFRERYRLMAARDRIDFIATYAAAFRRSLFHEAGGFDPAFPRPDHEDVDFAYRLAEQGCRMVFCPDAIVYHQHHPSLGNYLWIKCSRGFWRMRVYRRHPGKMVKDSYTPQTLKLQTLLALLLPPLALAAVFLTPARWALAAALLVFLATTMPLTWLALRLDPALAPLVPFYSLLRGFALGLGVSAAFVRGLEWESPEERDSDPGPRPGVSVVIPVYNAEASLEKCLKAVFDTDYPDFEVVVIDDGSTDGSAEIAARFPCRLLRQENRGAATARNEGVKAARAEFVLFVDSDCIAEPDWIGKMVAEFFRLEREFPGLAGIGGKVLPMPTYLDRCIAYAEYYPWQVAKVYEFNHLSTSNSMIRKQSFFDVGGFDPANNPFEDREFYHKIYRLGHRLVYTPNVSIVHDHPRKSLAGFLRHSYDWGKRQGLELELGFRDIRGTGYLRHFAHPLIYALLVLPISAAITARCVQTNFRSHPAVLTYVPVIFLSKIWYRWGVVRWLWSHPGRVRELLAAAPAEGTGGPQR